MLRKLFKFFFVLGVVLSLLGTATALMVGLYFYVRLTRDLPRIERIGDYRPKAVTSIFSDNGELIAELYDERRYPTDFAGIPLVVRNAFLAAEDANFYNHPGVDLLGIGRALWVNLHRQSNVQGASTITQQVVKALLLTRERTYERKAKEAILSYRLEQALTKDEIFSIYLNEIFLGSGAYGVTAAAKVHFHKELKDLSLAESAFLAGLPQRPTYLTEPSRFDEAIKRQHYVLDQMVNKGLITPEHRDLARSAPLKIFQADQTRVYQAPYCFNYVNEVLKEKLGAKVTNPGGFKVFTSCDVKAYGLAVKALQRGVREVDKRRGWRGVLATIKKGQVSDLLDNQALLSRGGLEPDKIYRALLTAVDKKNGILKVQVGDFSGIIKLKENKWAQKLINRNDDSTTVDLAEYLKVGHIIEVSWNGQGAAGDENKKAEEQPATKVNEKIESANKTKAPDKNVSEYQFQIDQTPELEAAFVLLNPLSGEVKVMVGGYDYQRSFFNRAFQALLQPGSAFKPFIYLSAIDYLGFTPATIVPDSPITLIAGNGKIWSPRNFDHKFLGPITLRTALQRSRNVVSVYLLRKVGLERVINTAKNLGISTPISQDLSIALGTSEVKLLDMVRAYGGFAAGGWLADSLVIRSIQDRSGEEIYQQKPHQKQVISEENAFIMANMMKGVVERGTATIIKKLGKPMAGKTGTTNEHMDAWFIGYNPEWVAGVWVGFDVKRMIGRMETGGKAAAPIFLYFMQDFLADKPALDFDPPDGVLPVPIIASSGHLADPNDSNAFIEYFKSGSEPKYRNEEQQGAQDYLSSDEF